jgi:Glycosyltransferase family 9 (heptosyltransferase)
MGVLHSLKHVYFRIGLHSAPRGTLLYYVDQAVRAAYVVGVRRKLIAPWQGSAARVASLRGIGRGNVRDELPDDVLVAFRITGGIGDHLLAARYVRDLLAAVGEFRFDIYSTIPEDALWIFGNLPQLNGCFDEEFSWNQNFDRYPLAMYLAMFAVIYAEETDWRRLEKRNRRLWEVCKTLCRFRPEIEPFIERHPRLDGFLARKAVFVGMQRHNFLHGMAGIAYGGHRLPLATAAEAMERFSLAGRRYITVHNGFSTLQAHMVERGAKATKCYPHFAEVVAGLRERLPGLTVVQLGAGTTSTPVDGVECNLLGRTTLPETAEILRHSLLHIDNESGLVHLAACLGVKSCVLFGPTDAEFFAYDSNINLHPPVCGGCWWITEDWMTTCPRGFVEARCLSQQRPETVIDAVVSYFGDGENEAPRRTRLMLVEPPQARARTSA